MRIRVVRPSVALILIGTNDVANVPLDEYRNNLQRIVQISLDRRNHPGREHHSQPPRL